MSTTIVLEAPAIDDFDAFVAMAAASRDLHHPWIEPPVTRDRFAAWCARASDPRHAPRLARLGSAGPIVGVVNLSEIVRGPLRGCFMGFSAAAEHAGRGRMRIAVSLALDLAFGPLGLHRVEANVQPGNARSRRLVWRLGFRREGFSPDYLEIGGAWRDHERWAIHADDPRPDASAVSADDGRTLVALGRTVEPPDPWYEAPA